MDLSSMNNNTDEFELRNEIIRITRLMVDQGLVRSSDGNISAKLDDGDDGLGRYLVTPSNRYKLSIEPDDLVLIRRDGSILKQKNGQVPSSEWKLHRDIYRLRPDVKSVIHAHPPYSTALTLTGQPFPVDLIPEVMATFGGVPIAAYALPGTEALAESVHPFISEFDAILLSHHGSVTVGKTLEESLLALERVEHAARIFFIARSVGPVVPLPPEEVSKIENAYRKNRANRPG
jgi:L-fuculose-phosphate aldolase